MNSRRLLLSASAVAASAGLYYSYTMSPSSTSSSSMSPHFSSSDPLAAAYGSITPSSSQRTIFVGDLHSDYRQTLATFRMAGLIGNDSTDWTGGTTTFVQTGDCVDRGNETKDIYALLEKLRVQAPLSGGQLVSLLGNHEVMQAMGLWNYVWNGDIQSFGGIQQRAHSMGLHGEIGQNWLKHYDVTAKVPVAPPSSPSFANQNAFYSAVHGGITPKFAKDPYAPYPDRINALGKSLLRKLMQKLESMQPQIQPPMRWSWPAGVTFEERELWRSEKPPHQDGPFWYRGYAEESEDKICKDAQEVLDRIGCRRMVMGHTPQPSVKSRCGNKVFIVDTGISAVYRGPVSALEVIFEVRDSLPEKPDVVLERERITALYLNKHEVLLDEWKEVPKYPKAKL